MRLTRVHVDAPLPTGAELALPEGAANHLVRVLRLAVGDRCLLFNGDGEDRLATVTAAGKRELRVRIDTAVPAVAESPLRIVLVQGIARGEKMDLILQKATELGVAGVVPVHSRRSEVRLDAERAAKRLAHWRSVVIAACEQSGRACVPEVAPPRPLVMALEALPADGARLVLDPDGSLALATLDAAPAGLAVLAVGPEGGWAEEDLAPLRAAGFQGLRLGPRILRTETAGLAAIAALQARFGDLG